jgi:hypothetical protein
MLRIVGWLAVTLELAALEQHKGIRQGDRSHSIMVSKMSIQTEGLTTG